MTLLEVGNGLLGLVVMIYLIAHSPAIVMLIIGLARLKTKPESAQVLIIISVIYFIVGFGVCSGMFG